MNVQGPQIYLSKGVLMRRVSKMAEDMLCEIIDHRTKNGMCDLDYWKKRMEESSLVEKNEIRKIFAELTGV